MTDLNKKRLRASVAYLLLLSGLAAIALFVRYGGLPLERGLLAITAWLMLFALAAVNARSAENRRLLESDEKERLRSVSRIQSVVARLQEKAVALNDSYGGEKQLLAQMSDSVQALIPSANLEASKMEYEILTMLTRLDFLCDKAIAGTDRGGDFTKELDALSTKMRARERL